MVLLSALSEEDPQDPNAGGLPYANPATLPSNPYGPGTGGYGPVVTPPASVNVANAPLGGGGGGGGGGINSDYFPSFDVGKAPAFRGPRFSLPTAESVLNLPGYKFREQQGRDALEHSAAAKGLTRTGGTLKDLATWNQGFASQEYDAEARRQLGAFQQNYQAEKDEYAPTFANWQFLSNAALQKALSLSNRYTSWNNPHAGGGGGGGYEEQLLSEEQYNGGA